MPHTLGILRSGESSCFIFLNMDLFKWSVPFLMEKVSDMLVYLTNKHLKDPIADKAVEKVNV